MIWAYQLGWLLPKDKRSILVRMWRRQNLSSQREGREERIEERRKWGEIGQRAQIFSYR